MVKKFSMVLLLSLVSCASLNKASFQDENYIGKFNLIQNNNNSNFSVVIFPLSEGIIIQVNKPLFGNVLNVNIDLKKGISINPESYKTQNTLARVNHVTIYKTIMGCLGSYKSNSEVKFTNIDGIKMTCSRPQNQEVLFDIEVDNIYINGFLRTKL